MCEISFQELPALLTTSENSVREKKRERKRIRAKKNDLNFTRRSRHILIANRRPLQPDDALAHVRYARNKGRHVGITARLQNRAVSERPRK